MNEETLKKLVAAVRKDERAKSNGDEDSADMVPILTAIEELGVHWTHWMAIALADVS